MNVSERARRYSSPLGRAWRTWRCPGRGRTTLQSARNGLFIKSGRTIERSPARCPPRSAAHTPRAASPKPRACGARQPAIAAGCNPCERPVHQSSRTPLCLRSHPSAPRNARCGQTHRWPQHMTRSRSEGSRGEGQRASACRQSGAPACLSLCFALLRQLRELPSDLAACDKVKAAPWLCA